MTDQELHRKVFDVIESCEFEDQLPVASKFASLASDKMSNPFLKFSLYLNLIQARREYIRSIK